MDNLNNGKLNDIFKRIKSHNNNNKDIFIGTPASGNSMYSEDRTITELTAIEVPMSYSGSEMKQGIIYYDETLDKEGVEKGWANYMMKFPDPIRKKSIELSYMNNQFSEHIGCEIFKSCGIETQETLLRRYVKGGTEKIVVLCKDFTKEDMPLIEMATLVNADISSGYKKDLSIESVMEVIDNSKYILDPEGVKNQFWDMFVMDALIGNTDRHYGNWGFLKIDGIDLIPAPVYDCGSSLAALVSDDMKEIYLSDEELFKNKEYNVSSVLRMNGSKVYYHSIFQKPPVELQEAVKRIVPRINMDHIRKVINNTPYMSEIHKEYLVKSIELRHDKIILPAYNKICKLEMEKENVPKVGTLYRR